MRREADHSEIDNMTEEERRAYEGGAAFSYTEEGGFAQIHPPIHADAYIVQRNTADLLAYEADRKSQGALDF